MTAEQRMYFDHCRRAGDYLVDKAACRESLARRAVSRGNTFFLTGATS